MAWNPYPYPNITGFYDMFQYANTVTDGYFGILFLFSIFMVSFLSTKSRYRTEICLAFSCYLTTMLSILMRVLLLVSNQVVLVCLFSTALVTLFLIKEKWIPE